MHPSRMRTDCGSGQGGGGGVRAGIHPLPWCILGYTPSLSRCMLGYTPSLWTELLTDM